MLMKDWKIFGILFMCRKNCMNLLKTRRSYDNLMSRNNCNFLNMYLQGKNKVGIAVNDNLLFAVR